MQQISKSIIICLNPECQQQSRYLKGLNMNKHNPACSAYLFGIQDLLSTKDQHIAEYPVHQLGKIVKSKVLKTKQNDKRSYLQLLLDDFKATIIKMIDDAKDELFKIYPESELQVQYNKIFRLDQIKSLIKNGESSKKISQRLKFMHAPYNYAQLQAISNKYDEINIQLNNVIDDINSIFIHHQKNLAIKRKDQIEKKRPIIKKYTPNIEIDYQVVYGLLKSQYTKCQQISVQSGWVIFPPGDENHFKPWIYGQKGFTTGVHKLKFTATKPQGSLNCGIAIIPQSDLQCYPYGVYKSLYDKITKQFKLISGKEINLWINESTIVEVTMDCDHKKVILTDNENKCQYLANIKDNTKYYFGIVGSLWKVKIIHLT